MQLVCMDILWYHLEVKTALAILWSKKDSRVNARFFCLLKYSRACCCRYSII